MGNKYENISKNVFFIAICFFLFVLLPLKNERNPKVLGLQSDTLLRGLPISVESDFYPLKIKDIDLSGIEAESYIVFERQTGKVLLEKNIHQKLQIASITKLLTADLALKYIDLTKNYEFYNHDKITIKPIAGLMVGDMVSGQDLIISMLVGSANDSAKKIGSILEATNGIEIAEQMNKRAGELGMTESHFSNPMGFDDNENYSTAKDVYLLVKENLNHGLYDLIARNKTYKFSGVKGDYYVRATNKLISRDSNIFAVKTGNTPEALGAMVTRSIISGKEMVFIVLKSKNREEDTLKLRELVAKSFNW